MSKSPAESLAELASFICGPGWLAPAGPPCLAVSMWAHLDPRSCCPVGLYLSILVLYHLISQAGCGIDVIYLSIYLSWVVDPVGRPDARHVLPFICLSVPACLPGSAGVSTPGPSLPAACGPRGRVGCHG